MISTFSRPVLEANTRIDFYAGSDEAFQKLSLVYNSLPENRRGKIYERDFGNYLDGENPLVITNPNDLFKVFYAGEERPFIFIEFEHHKQTRGLLGAVSLFLCNNKKDFDIRRAYTEKYQTVAMFTDYKSIANEIIKFVIGVSPLYRNKIGSKSIGLLYMAFGERAGQAVKKSVATLKRIGYSYPVCVVGDQPVDGFEFREWTGESPFDRSQKKNFQYRAGRIKPKLYEYSPFDLTLYLDADTEFYQDIYSGFEALVNDCDMIVTRETLTIGELYNKFMAGWEINIEERDQTVKEFGGRSDIPFINTGVFFFRKNKEIKTLFSDWHKEWMRFQQWDEQLAFMRAEYKNEVDAKVFPVNWNDPHVHDDTIIFHNYGRGHVRQNA